jgi:hypothetical protein
VFNQSLHDRLAQTASLVDGIDGDVDDLEEQPFVADDPSHADDFARLVLNHHGEDSVRQAGGRCFCATRG